MKKNLPSLITFVLIMVMALGVKSYAQSLISTKAPAVVEYSSKAVILSESFDDATFPPTGWTNVIGSGTYSWERVTAGIYPACTPHSGAALAMYNSYNASSGSHALLISPVINLTGNTGIYEVSFWMFHDAGYTNDDKIDVYVNTVADSTGATLLGTAHRPTGTGWLQHTFVIPGTYNTATNYLIFTATSAYGNSIHMDDVAVNSPEANDVGITAIIDPAYMIAPGAVTPQITVKNFGTAAQTGISVNYKIGTSGTVVNTTIASLASGASTNVSFPSWAATDGTYDFIFYTGLAGDANHINDTMKLTVTVTDVLWAAGANSTLPAYLGSAATCGGKLYCMGGNQPDAAGSGVGIYDVTANSWAAGTSLPAARVIGMAAGTSTQVYYLGGSDGTNYQNTVWALTPPGTTWDVKAPLPVTLGWAKTAVYQDSLIYVMGGVEASTTAVATVYLYNTNTNTWRICTPMPAAVFGGAAGITGNTLIWTSGADLSVTSTATYEGVIDPVNHATITWTTGTPLPAVAFRTDGGTWGPDEVIIATGSINTGWVPASPNPCYAYNPTTNVWRILPNKTTPTLGGFTATLLFSSTAYSQTWKLVSASGYDGAAASIVTEILTEEWSTAGITTNSMAKFSIYPNPVSDILNITSDKVINNVNVYSISGQLVYSRGISDVNTEINISTFENGIYILQIESEDGLSIQKFNVTK